MARRRRRARGDDFSKPVSDPGGIYPTKGKGWGQLGEATFPDLLSHWDGESSWTSWRRGMELAYSGKGAGITRLGAVDVLIRPAFQGGDFWASGRALAVSFPSSTAPRGAWNVVVKPRGIEGSVDAVAPASQRVEFLQAGPDVEPLRVIIVSGVAGWGAGETTAVNTLVGELIEDTLDSEGRLLSSLEGHALLCVQVRPETNEMVFDATRSWSYRELGNGALVLEEHRISDFEEAPLFRTGRRLTQAMTLSCDCPSHQGAVYAMVENKGRLGSQRLFPQEGGQSLPASTGPGGPQSGEGVRRRFGTLEPERIPGRECKHCHAVRFLLRVPIGEPTDVPSLAGGNFAKGGLIERLEEMSIDVVNEQLQSEVQDVLMRSEMLRKLDVVNLQAAAGDAFGVLPMRLDLNTLRAAASSKPAIALITEGLQQRSARFNEAHFTANPQDDDDIVRGDWWVGRGDSPLAYAYDGPSTLNEIPALRWSTVESGTMLLRIP